MPRPRTLLLFVIASAVGLDQPACVGGAEFPKLVIQSGHRGTVDGVAFSPDGQLVLTSAHDRTSRLWDAATGRLLHTLQGSNARFSADGKAMLTAADFVVRLWDVGTGKLIRDVGVPSRLRTAQLSPDGKVVLVATQDKTARLWSVATGKLLHELEHPDQALSAAFSPNGNLVQTQALDNSVRLWDTATGTGVHTLKHTDAIRSVQFSPDGKAVLTASNDKTVRLWSTATGKLLHALGHSSLPLSVVFSRNGQVVLTVSLDNTARVWDTTNGKVIHELKGPITSSFKSGQFSPDGTVVLLASSGKTVATLWDLSSGKLCHAFESADVEGGSAVYSPDGKVVLTHGGYPGGKARLWSAETGKLLNTLVGHRGAIFSHAFSPDGKSLLTGSMDDTARIWERETGRTLHVLGGHDDRLRKVSVSPTGAILVWAWDGSVRVWDPTTGRARDWFAIDNALTTDCTPDGGNVASALVDGSIVLSEARNRRSPRRLKTATTGAQVVAMSPDGSKFLHGYATLSVRDFATGDQLAVLRGHEGPVGVASFSPDSRQVLTGSVDESARLWEAATGKLVHTFEKHEADVRFAIFSPDGKTVLTSSYTDTARVWDVATGKLRHSLTNTAQNRSVGFSPDGATVIIGGHGGTVWLWDVVAGKLRHTLKGHSDTVWSVAFSPDGTTVATAAHDNTARLWDTATGKLRYTLSGHSGPLRSVAFSLNGKFVFTASDDGSVIVWQVGTGTELCRLYGFSQGSWAVVDPANRYDASNGGDVDGLHWVVGGEPIALSQLKNRYYEPGLLAKLLGHNKEPLRDVAAFGTRKVVVTGFGKAPTYVIEAAPPRLYPAVSVAPVKDGKATVTLANRGGGIGKVVVKVNGKELLADARGDKPDPDAKFVTLSVDLATAGNLIPGQKNTVEVVAYNAEGYLSSRGATADYDAPAGPEKPTPKLHAIICGVSTYAGEKLNLKYAAKDAEDFAAALKLGGERLFGPGNAKITLLSTSGAAGTTLPTKDNLRKAFEAAKKAAGPTDVLVVYLAGHGTTLARGSDLYLYPTRDATSLAAEAFADPAVRAAAAVSSDELTDWVKAVPANKQVLILDTCAAGAAAAKLTEKRDVSGDQVRALDRLKDRAGVFVLMGCAADAVSYETTRFAQGLLTYSLLEGMKGAALTNGEFAEVDKLFAYATDRVPALAGDVGGVQRPLVASPKGAGFPVARLTAEDKPKVPLASPRPLVLASNFQEEARTRDGLGLKKLVDARLRDLAGAGRGAKLVFVDATEFPGGVEVGGRYKIDGDAVSVRVTLFQGDKEVTSFTVGGDKAKLDELAAKLVAEVEKNLPAGK